MSGKKDFYSPLVSGAPRTGFTLLITIARHLIRFAKSRRDNKLKLLRALVETLGEHVHHSIVQACAEEGIKRDLVFNPMFHPLIGGPKWISQDDSRYACFRKYIGISGKGDFTLIMKHPRAIMDCDTVVHSHVAPSTWLELPEYDGHTRFAAMRNPCGTLNSATFSINAITSEYIQRFLPPEDDNDMLRQYLAKYKLTNLVFFERLVDFYRSYYADFAGCREHFITLKWEDLILQPVKTILQLAHQAGIELPEHGAKAIWSSMAYRSLGHQHNFRKGKVGDWMTSLLNEHLEIIKGSGIEQIMVEMGYGPIRYLNEADYTPFQREMVGYVRRGKVYEDYPDPNLFLFAFQKSNIKWDGLLNFKEYPWRTWTKIERSSFDDDRVVQKVWEAAESAASSVNPVLLDFLEGDYSQPRAAADYLEKLNGKHGALLETMEDGRYKYAIQNLLKIKIEEERTMRVAPITVPKTALQWDPALNLSFVQNEADVFLSNIKVYLKKGARSFLFRPFNEVAADLVKRMLDRGETGEQCRFFALERECRAAAPRRVEILAEQDAEFAADVTVMLEDDPDALSSLLLNSIDMRQGTILAPVTSRFSQKNPLFVVAIPKSGTHLLFELVRALGYTDGLTLTDPPRNGFWYFLEYSNAHTSARDFFIDSVRRAQFGNRRHPFRTSPTLFMYRNPMDIVVSEASYYHREGKTAFGGYLSELSPEERLLRLINDPWLLGTIRDRLGNFIAWMDFPNVIPISFEELIGSKGEGSDEVRDRLIWSVQLKLHVPGNPPVIGAKVFNEASPTFRKGQAGSHRHYFTPRAYSAFEELPQDFMEKLGYEAREEETSLVLPKRVEEFRKRPLKLGTERFTDTLVMVEEDFLGYAITVYRNVFYASPNAVITGGDGGRERGQFSAGDLSSLKLKIVRSLANLFGDPSEFRKGASPEIDFNKDAISNGYSPFPLLVEEGYDGYNIVLFEHKFYAIALAVGPIDINTTDNDTLARYANSGQIITGTSLNELKALIDRLGCQATPLLVEENYRGFNIVQYQYTFYAISLALGHVDLTTLDDSTLCEYQERRKCFLAMSAEGVKQLIDQILRPDSSPPGLFSAACSGLRFDGSENDRIYLSELMARLIQGSRRPVFFGTGRLCTYVFNMLPQIRRSISLILDDRAARGFPDFAGIPIYPLESIPSDVDAVFLCETDEKTAAEIKAKLPADMKVVALEPVDIAITQPGDITSEYRDYNLVEYQNVYYAFWRKLGPIDPARLDKKTLMKYQINYSCITGNSIEELKQRIDCVLA